MVVIGGIRGLRAFAPDQYEALLFSRRRFLEASTLAGLIAVPRMLERKVAAAEGDPPEKTRASAVPQHPLEPLTADEVTLAVETLKQGRKLGDSFRSAIRMKVANAPFAIGQPFAKWLSPKQIRQKNISARTRSISASMASV